MKNCCMSYVTQRNPPHYAPFSFLFYITNWHYTEDNHWIYCFIVVVEDELETNFCFIFVWTTEWKII